MTNLQKDESIDDTIWPASCRPNKIVSVFICALEIHRIDGLIKWSSNIKKKHFL